MLSALHVDQTGYLPDSLKLAILVPGGNKAGDTDTASPAVSIRTADGGVVTGVTIDIGPVSYDATAGESAARVDFSGLTEEGAYYLEATDGADTVRSDTFRIAGHVYREVLDDMCRALYFQRCGCELPAEIAGEYARHACHVRDAVLYEDRTVRLALRGGWHDAGDFGRYASVAGTTLGHLLYAWELFPEALSDQLHIPESGDGMPDILSECRYELDFLLQLQAEDGGVYHKVTTMRHPDFLMPEEDDGELFVFPVSSVATGAFAAAMCIASRVYEPYEPDLSRTMLHAAVEAGQWLLAHPDYPSFHNPPECNTGEYGDDDDRDERLWAFTELLRTDILLTHEGDRSHAGAGPHHVTRQERYRREIERLWRDMYEDELATLDKYDRALAAREEVRGQKPILSDGFGWTDNTTLAILSATVSARAAEQGITSITADISEEIREEMTSLILAKADRLISEGRENVYHLAMQPRDFTWGSSMVVTNRADLLILASMLTDDEERVRAYERQALEQLHYLLGRNAPGVSYVTGHGEHAFLHPHNRVTSCDGVDAPIPGEVSGGPCFPPLDPEGERLVPAGSVPQYCYADAEPCYSLNEITIYWNSSAIFAAAFFNR